MSRIELALAQWASVMVVAKLHTYTCADGVGVDEGGEAEKAANGARDERRRRRTRADRLSAVERIVSFLCWPGGGGR